jgi:hypothetical protein
MFFPFFDNRVLNDTFDFQDDARNKNVCVFNWKVTDSVLNRQFNVFLFVRCKQVVVFQELLCVSDGNFVDLKFKQDFLCFLLLIPQIFGFLSEICSNLIGFAK